MTSISLWAGWRIILPECNQTRNVDGSWSAWGNDWVVDVIIIECNGPDGKKLAKESLFKSEPNDVKICGNGWIGSQNIFTEIDNGNSVIRVTNTLFADSTICSLYVSIMDDIKIGFAQEIVNMVSNVETLA